MRLSEETVFMTDKTTGSITLAFDRRQVTSIGRGSVERQPTSQLRDVRITFHNGETINMVEFDDAMMHSLIEAVWPPKEEATGWPTEPAEGTDA